MLSHRLEYLAKISPSGSRHQATQHWAIGKPLAPGKRWHPTLHGSSWVVTHQSFPNQGLQCRVMLPSLRKWAAPAIGPTDSVSFLKSNFFKYIGWSVILSRMHSSKILLLCRYGVCELWRSTAVIRLSYSRPDGHLVFCKNSCQYDCNVTNEIFGRVQSSCSTMTLCPGLGCGLFFAARRFSDIFDRWPNMSNSFSGDGR